jgi:phage baseplate assembly protein gpV
MDRRERVGDPEETQRMIFAGQQSKLWTALPGIIESFDPSAMTCTVRPAISGARLTRGGATVDVEIPLLLDCPVCFPGGGGVTLTFPIAKGDECLVVFASRCIDSWWQLGGVRGQAEHRMHDLSDGFVLPGVRSQPRKFSVSTAGAQLRTDDGAAFVEIDPGSHKIKAETSGDIEAQASGSITLSAPTITLNGAIVLNGPITQSSASGLGTSASMIGPLSVTNDVTAGGKSLEHHVHSGVVAGGANTGQPV